MTAPRFETILELKMPLDERLKIYALAFGDGGDEVGIVTGLHGDEHDGLYVAYRLAKHLRDLPEERLKGRVTIIPAANPMGLDVSRRFWPVNRRDINRSFPGLADGNPTDRMADAIFRRLRGCRTVVDIHSSNIFLREVPQIRVGEEFASRILPDARHLGMEVVWIHPSPTVIETTLSYNLNQSGVPAHVVEIGVGLRLTLDFADRVFHGVVNLLHRLGTVDGPPPIDPPPPRIARDADVEFVNAGAAGLFLAATALGRNLAAGEMIGTVVDPVHGEEKEEIRAPAAGYVFTLRAHPVVYPGSLVARMIKA